VAPNVVEVKADRESIERPLALSAPYMLYIKKKKAFGREIKKKNPS